MMGKGRNRVPHQNSSCAARPVHALFRQAKRAQGGQGAPHTCADAASTVTGLGGRDAARPRRRTRVGASRLSEPAGQGGDPLSAGRRRRHRGPHPVPEARRDVGRAQFVVDNRGGAGGTIAAAVVAKAEHDGYTIMYDATAFSVNPSLYPRLPYDTVKDFEPIFLSALITNLLVVNKSVEAKTVADVIALAKATPGGLDWASSGNGTVQHLALEMFRHRAGIQLNHIPYRGGGLVLNDLIAG